MKKLLAIVLALAMVMALGAAAFADGQTYAIITKSAGNPYNEREASGFQEVIEAAGYEAIIKHPAEITAEAQITLINELVRVSQLLQMTLMHFRPLTRLLWTPALKLSLLTAPAILRAA